MHRLSAYQAAEWTQSGLAAAPLPYLAVSNYHSIYLFFNFFLNFFFNFLELPGYLHGREDPDFSSPRPCSEAGYPRISRNPYSQAARICSG